MAGKTAKKRKPAGKAAADRIFAERLGRHHDELRWLYMELYGNDDMFAELCDQMKWYYDQRNDKLKKLDARREAEGAWYRKRDMLGMMMYIDNFAGTIKGVEEKLSYLEKCHVNYVHLMPFLDSPEREIRRRLRRGGLPEGEAGAWDHGGSGPPGGKMP